MKISKVTIELINNDGTRSKVETVMPYELAEELIIKVIDWKNRISTTPATHEEFMEAEKKFKP